MSVLSRIRSYAVQAFEEHVEKPFKNIDVTDGANNLLGEIALAVQIPSNPTLYQALRSSVAKVKADYNRGIAQAYSKFDKEKASLDAFNYTSEEKLQKINELELILSQDLDEVNTEANAAMATLEKEFAFVPEIRAVLGYFAYYITYSDNNTIERNKKAGYDPTRNLSFPWAGATHQLLAAVSKVSGKDPSICTFQNYVPKKLITRIGGFDITGFDSNFVVSQIQRIGHFYVWNQEITEGIHAGQRIFNVYVGKVNVGFIYANRAYAFTGHDKFKVVIDSVKVDGKSVEVSVKEIIAM